MTDHVNEPTINDVLDAIGELGTRMVERITRLDQRVDGLEMRVNELENRVSSRILNLERSVQDMGRSVQDMGVALGTALRDLAAIKEHLGIHVPRPV